jgi:uncharacterized protein YbaR (Trm112 family)
VKLWLLHPDALAVPLELEIDPGFMKALDRRLAPWRATLAIIALLISCLSPKCTSWIPNCLNCSSAPVTKGPFTYDRERQELVSRSARLAYPVRDGIPVLLENEARTLTDEELQA